MSNGKFSEGALLTAILGRAGLIPERSMPCGDEARVNVEVDESS